MGRLCMIYKYFRNKVGFKSSSKNHGFGLLDCTYNESFKETKQFYQMNHSKTTYNRTKVDVVEKK